MTVFHYYLAEQEGLYLSLNIISVRMKELSVLEAFFVLLRMLLLLRLELEWISFVLCY